jgi:uncharacterized damage-inducible protein DinB
MELKTLSEFLKYSEWANGELLRASRGLSDAQLDQPFDMGMGYLRRTLLHLHAGEHVWLQRWQGRTETPWPDEKEKVSVEVISTQFAKTYAERTTFLSTVQDGDLGKLVTYRDSKGSLFAATLGDMITQGILHSTHHRAQAVNMLRRAADTLVELDYMMWVRKPA